MQNVSEEYKAAMKLPLRNRSDMQVVIGRVNMTAQLSAKAKTMSPETNIYFSTPNAVFKSDTDKTYSTMENNFTPCDGSMFFAPRTDSGVPYYDTGFVSKNRMSSTSTSDQNGLIAYSFDEVATPSLSNPFVMMIWFEEKGKPVTIDVSFEWDNERYYGWSGVSVASNPIKITATSAPTGRTKITGAKIKGYGDTTYRMRIKKIVFGTGTILYSDIIEKSEQTDYTSKINENLPTRDVRVDLINYDARYDADNPDNPLALLDEDKQTINVYYGYDVSGSGDYEWVHGGTFISDSWSSGKHRASIMGKDMLQNNDNLFIHSNSQLEQYNTAEDWLQYICGALTTDPNHPITYECDSDMSSIIMTLPLVRTVPAKEVLQQLANYCCKTLLIDNDGKIKITSVEDDTSDFEITSNDVIDDMTIEKEELVKEVVVPFYTYSYIPTEEVVISDEIVNVPSNNYVYAQSFGDTIYGFVGVEITDAVPLATKADLTSYQGTRLQTGLIPVTYGETYITDVDNLIGDKQIYYIYEFDSNDSQINAIEVKNRAYTYTPSSASVVKARVYIRYPDDSAISPSDVGEFRFAHEVLTDGYPDEPLDYWYGTLQAGDYRIRITAMGYFQFTSADVHYQINNSGKSLRWDNPLVGSQDRAIAVAEFVGDYLQSNLSYNYKYRGNPELNANDVIKQENDFIADMEVIVSEHKIGFNGALSGEITARRRSEG